MAKSNEKGEKKDKVTMTATDGEGQTHRMTGSGQTGRTQTSEDGKVTQTDGDQVIVEE